MNGDQIRTEREARGWTQADLAAAVRVGKRTVSNWETGGTVPRNRMGMLHKVLGIAEVDDEADPLRSASDFALLSELLRRALDRGQ